MATGDRDAAEAAPQRRRVRIPMTFLQDYEVIRGLGSGGFGVVIKARHRVTGQTVAIKRIPSSDGHYSEVWRESSFLDTCKGVPFVVRSHGLARDRATSELCLLMEYVGPSLHDYLCERRRCPPLPEATVRAIMSQLLTGAQGMHRVHVIHRDIKPANILVGDGNRTVKIGDLGLAISMRVAPPYTQAGTLPYMAPEVLLGQTDYDALVDTWSLGCVMAELILRRPLFEGTGEVGQLSAIFNVLGVPDSRTWPGFESLPLAAEVAKLQKQPCNRLRDIFPEEMLPKEGFDLLNGLLTCNPGKRLTAAAALKLPWFDKVDDLALPHKDEVVVPSMVPKRKRLRIVLPGLPKRPRVLLA